MTGATHALAWGVTGIGVTSIALLGIFFVLLVSPVIVAILVAALHVSHSRYLRREFGAYRLSLPKGYQPSLSIRYAVAATSPQFVQPTFLVTLSGLLRHLAALFGLGRRSILTRLLRRIWFRLFQDRRQLVFRSWFGSILPNVRTERAGCLARLVLKHET